MDILRPFLCVTLIGALALPTASAWADGQGSATAAQAGQQVISMGGTLFAGVEAPVCFNWDTAATGCPLMAIGIAAAAASALLSASNGDAASGLGGAGFGTPGNYSFDDPNLSGGDPSLCMGADTSQCTPAAAKAANAKMLSDLSAKVADGSLPPDVAASVGGMLDAIKSGDLAAIEGVLSANQDKLGGLADYMPKDSVGVAFSGEEAAETPVVASKAPKKGAHENPALGAVDWNGTLDMINSKTGKSLTLWQRATRRYRGGPEGRRGLMLARMEVIRKTAIAKLKSKKGTSAVATREVPAPKTQRKPASLGTQN